MLERMRSQVHSSPTEAVCITSDACGQPACASSHGLQLGPKAKGHVAIVVPPDAHAVRVDRVGDYHAGRIPPAQAHSGAEEQRGAVVTECLRGVGLVGRTLDIT